MTKTRTYRWWEDAEPELMAAIRGRIEDGASYADIHKDLDLGIRCDIELRTFQEYATGYKRTLRIQRAAERASYRVKLCAALGIEVDELDPIKRLKLSTIVETIASAAKAGVRLRSVDAHNYMAELELKQAKNAREEEKLAWQREQRQRKERADVQAAKLLEQRGQGDLAEDIRRIYGVVVE